MQSDDSYRINICRICGSSELVSFLNLGPMPIPNGFLSRDDLKKKEDYYPLKVCVCKNCWLVQLTHTIPPEIMFENYVYIPSTSLTMTEHFKSLSKELIKNYALDSNSLVIDVGSNDGTLLGYFKEQEIQVLGIDPAANLAHLSNLKGIPTINDFFSNRLANKLRKTKGKAKVITATNVVAHIHDLNDLMNGINTILDKDGVFVMEFPYLVDLFQKNEFDTIYHEHLSYFSLQPLTFLFKKHRLVLIDVKRVPVHGGSLRVYVAKKKSKNKQSKRVPEFILQERLKKFDKKNTYDDFARRVKVIRRDLTQYLKRLKKEGKRIVGYGAAAKGNVLLNYCKIGSEMLDYIVDSIPFKQGKYTPGTHIRIFPESKLEKEMPDYALLLSWNFADEILRKQQSYREKGGQFIITIPYLRIE